MRNNHTCNYQTEIEIFTLPVTLFVNMLVGHELSNRIIFCYGEFNLFRFGVGTHNKSNINIVDVSVTKDSFGGAGIVYDEKIWSNSRGLRPINDMLIPVNSKKILLTDLFKFKNKQTPNQNPNQIQNINTIKTKSILIKYFRLLRVANELLFHKHLLHKSIFIRDNRLNPEVRFKSFEYPVTKVLMWTLLESLTSHRNKNPTKKFVPIKNGGRKY